jgi:hypothetical protein
MANLICGNPRGARLTSVVEAVQARVGRWAIDDLNLFIEDVHPNFDPSVYTTTLKSALEAWTVPLGINVHVLQAGIDRGKSYDIVAKMRKIDGKGGILAQCELPNGSGNFITMTVDVDENFSLEHDGDGYVDLLGPVTHEWGHGMGLEHNESPEALMYWQWLGKFKTPQPLDLQELHLLYKDRIPKPTVPSGGTNWEELYRKAALEIAAYRNKQSRIRSVLDE